METVTVSMSQPVQPRNLEYRRIEPTHLEHFERLVSMGSLKSVEVKNKTWTGKADYRLEFPDGTVLFLYHSDHNGGHKLVPVKAELEVPAPVPQAINSLVQDKPLTPVQKPVQVEQLATEKKAVGKTKKSKRSEKGKEVLPSWMNDDVESEKAKAEEWFE